MSATEPLTADGPSMLATAADAYARNGVHIFPCWWAVNGLCGCGDPECGSPGKHPIGHLTPHGLKDATNDPDTVTTWWAQYPNANIAIALEPNDVFVLDVDGPTGRSHLDELEDTYHALPDTYQVVTGRAEGSGHHHVFRQPTDGPRIGNAKLGHPKLETKGDGGYVIAPPSIHASGRPYLALGKWTQIVDAPGWLLALARKPKREQNTADPAPPIEFTADPNDDIAHRRLTSVAGKVATAVEGTRNDMLNWAAHTAGRLIGAGRLQRDQVETVLETAALRAGLSERETRTTIASGIDAGITDPDHDTRSDSPLIVPAVTVIQAEQGFWDARPELDHIRTFARARRASPWAVLAVALTRLTVAIPPSYVLPAIIGGQASLNLFAGIVARSGGGKGAAEAAATDALDVGDIHTTGVGSGEGILHQYVRYVPENKKTGEPARLDQHNTAVLFTISEVDTLAALHGRQGSTLLSELRKVYMGEELSFAYVDPTKRLKVERHSYRAGLIAGIQPTRAGILLDDADGGTPQRFIWVPGVDPNMPDTPPDEPERLRWPVPPEPSMTGISGRYAINVCDTARDTIDAEHVKRNRGHGDALDGHALLTRLKWAAALGFLDGRNNVSDDDWALAGIVMAVSDATRNAVSEQLKKARAAENIERGRGLGIRESVKEETIAGRAIERVRRRLLDRLHDGNTWPHHELRKTLASRDRRYFDEAIQRLIDSADVIADDEIHRTSYRFIGGSK